MIDQKRSSLASVAESGRPAKYLSRQRWKTSTSGAARANRVIDERNFISSIEAEDLARGSALDVEREPRALPQPRAEDRVREIGLRLVERGDREADRHGALSEARDLGKDEPHPVALLPSGLKFPTHLIVDRRLRVDEAFEVERIRHAPPGRTVPKHGVPAQRLLPKPERAPGHQPAFG